MILPQIPKMLLDLSNPPKQLFYLGDLNPEIFENCVSIVGSRKITEYGKQIIEKLVPQLVFSGKTIVSGFMYGTDQYVHKTTIENGGKTIAILGWGISKKLSGFDKKLAQEIIDSGGLIISEWEDQEGTNWTFPVRDRLIAGISDEIYVTEAAEKSGSLITARDAIKLKRKIWAVPGPITSKTSVGTNNLIASGKAKMWLPHYAEASRGKPGDPILQILQNESLTADELARKLNKSVAEVGNELTILILSGQVNERNGKYYIPGI